MVLLLPVVIVTPRKEVGLKVSGEEEDGVEMEFMTAGTAFAGRGSMVRWGDLGFKANEDEDCNEGGGRKTVSSFLARFAGGFRFALLAASVPFTISRNLLD